MADGLRGTKEQPGHWPQYLYLEHGKPGKMSQVDCAFRLLHKVPGMHLADLQCGRESKMSPSEGIDVSVR